MLRSPYSTQMMPTSDLRCLIVENDTVLSHHVQKTLGYAFPHIFVVGRCGSLREFIRTAARTKPDLLLLDINLPDGTVFEALQELDTANMELIIMSASRNFNDALEAIRYGASGYILKPFCADEFIQHVNAALQKLRSKRQFIQILDSAMEPATKIVFKTCHKTLIKLDPRSITRLEANGKCTKVFLANGATHRVVGVLSEVLAKLPRAMFYQTHRSFVVNLAYVEQARNYFALLKTGERVEVSIRTWTRFVAVFREYYGRQFCEV